MSKRRLAIALSAMALVGTMAPLGAHAQRVSQLSMLQLAEEGQDGKPFNFKVRTPQSGTSVSGPTRPVTNYARAPRVEASGYVPTLYGIVIYDNTWTSDTKEYGVYSFPASATGFSMTKEASGDEFGASCGYGIDDTYHFVTSQSYSYYLYDYNMENWSQTAKTQVWSKAYIGMDLTYDATTQKIYGAFPNSSYGADHLIFGVVDYTLSYNNVTEIASFDDLLIVAMAANSEGKVYAISQTGDLYLMDKTSGSRTLVGNTGVSASDYVQSAAFDPKTGYLYWACTLADETSALYQIDVTNATTTKVLEFPHNQEIVALYIPAPKAEDGAPAAATDLKASFKDGSLTGTVTFTVPTTTFDGNTLTGDVTYTVMANDSTVATGTASAGSTVTVTVTLPASGETVFKVVLTNSVGNSPATKLTQWVGNDEPKPVESVTLTIDENGKAQLVWPAVRDGLHGGYMDADKVTYRVTRYPGGTVVATVSDTEFSEQLDVEASLANYYYTVEAINGDMVSTPTQSNVVSFGAAFSVPFVDDQSTQDYLPFYLVVDANQDGTTWGYSDWYGLCYSYSYSNSADDWLFSPPIRLDGEATYQVTFVVACGYSGTERLAVGYGLGTDYANYTEMMPATEIKGSDEQTFSYRITPTATGDYRVGFHALSDANQYRIMLKSLSVEVAIPMTVPDTVQHMTVTPAAMGELKATVTMDAPTLTQEGKQLESLTKIELYRNEVLVNTFEKPQVGASLSWEDTNPVNGMNTYSAIAYNEDGAGLAATAEAWVGLDAPLAPTNVRVVDMADSVLLTWDAPVGNVGVHGGYVDPAKVRYSIYDPSNGMAIVAEHLDATSYLDTKVHLENEGKQGTLYYIVYAETALDDGTYLEGKGAMSPYMRTGALQSIPFAESVTGGEIQAEGCWSENNYYYTWGITTDMSADNDGGALAFHSYRDNDWSIWHTPKLSLAGSESPYFSFSYYANPSWNTTLYVLAMGPDYQTVVLDSIKLNEATTTGWVRKSYSLEAFKSSRYVIMGVKAVVATYSDYAVIDNIVVRDMLQHDIMAELEAPSTMYAGLKSTVTVKVTNVGLDEARDYQVKFYCNDQLMDTRAGEALTTDGAASYAFELTPSATEQTMKVYAVAEYAIDMKPANNTTEVKTITIQVSDLPTVDSLGVSLIDGETVDLQWRAVASETGVASTDSFEDYADWAETFGEWITVDGDGAYSYSLGSSFPFDRAGYPFAFKVMNPTNWELNEETHGYLDAHTGNKYVACFDAAYTDETYSVNNDDWLISPELSGTAQTISFYAKSLHIDETTGLETFEICYSNGSTDVADFQVLTTVTSAAADWTEYTQLLPEGAKRFAIHVTSKKCHALFVDDVTYIGKTNEVKGYNIYRDGVLVATVGADETHYTEAYDGDSNHQYQVSVIYTTGESELSYPVSLGTSGVTNVMAPQGYDENTRVYTILGQYVGKGLDCIANLQPGLYLIGGNKVLVK